VTENAPGAVARSLVGTVRDQQLTFLAAAIAYYAFVSVIPLVLVAVAVASAVAGERFAQQVVELTSGLLTPEAATLLETAITSGAGRGSATVVGLAVLLWSGLRVFRGLDVAFARLYGEREPVSLLAQIRDAVLVVTAIAVAISAAAAVEGVLSLPETTLGNAVRSLVSVASLSAVFFPLYYVFPEREIGVLEAVPGTVLAAGGWTLLGTGFTVYAERAVSFQLYGVIGGVLLVLTWFYFAGMVLLLGAALNAVLAGGRRDRQLQQEGHRDGTQRMSERDESDDNGDGEDVSTVEPTVDYEDIVELRRELDRFEEEIEDRTVHREELEGDLRKYVRRRVRRGHARGWGPYLVLLYGTIMTLGAFYFLDGGWAILAMLVVWLSTLGLYTLMVLVGVGLTAAGVPGRVAERLRDLR
jgi:YihY family inner membrane protein